MVDPETILRRFLLWAVVCSVSAAPSFYVAHHSHHRGAMVLGVALFTLAYTAFTSTERFERFHNLPFVRRTLYTGYGLRVIVSIVFPVGLGLDMVPGAISINFVEKVIGLNPQTFAGTLLTTIVQGTLLNVILTVFMTLVYGVQRATMKPPEAPQGFEVVMPVIPAAPPHDS